MNKLFLNTIVFSLFLISGSIGYGQSLTTVNLNITKDSYIDTKYPSNSFGSSSTLKTTTHAGFFRGQFSYSRTYVESDLSSIPSNAQISSAKIKLRRNGSANGTFTWTTKLVTGSWNEVFLNANSQPTISPYSSDWTTTSPNPTGFESIDVTSTVQRMVYGQVSNYGWCIQLTNEGLSGISGENFFSSDYGGSSTYKPVLEIQYYIPLSVTSVLIGHESTYTADDGSICFGLNGGGSSTYTIELYDGASNTLLTTYPSVSWNANSCFNDLTYGWYGIHVTGSYGEELYQAFIVGVECKEVTITFQPDKNYTKEAWLYGHANYKNTNYNYYPYLRTEDWNYNPWIENKNVFGFKLWMDDDLEVNQADLTLFGWAHYNPVVSNQSELVQITTDWMESVVTWNTTPSVNNSLKTLLPNTTSSQQNQTVDISNFWDVWKQNNASNYGMLFQLQNFYNFSNTRQGYYGSAYGTPSKRPSIEFKIAKGTSYECSDIFFYLKREVEQTIAFVPGSKLKFRFQEDYFDASGVLDYTITLLENNSQQVGTLPKSEEVNWFELENGLGGVTLTSGKNYLIEVVNSKGQKSYLKFKMS